MSSSDRAVSRRRAVGRLGSLAGLLALGGLAGCGFALRRTPPLPFRRLALTGFAPRSPLAAALADALAGTAELVASPAKAEVVLRALTESRERTVVAQTAAAQVREIQLRLRVAFSAATPSGRELLGPTELLLARDLSTSETQALAKQLEEESLFREMQADAVQQVLQRLSALRL